MRIVLGTSLLTKLGTNVDKMNNVQFLLFLSKALAKLTRKSTQVCKTRTCVRTKGDQTDSSSQVVKSCKFHAYH